MNAIFYRTPLEGHLRELDVDTVVVCGCNFPNCPRTTIYEASERDFHIVFVPDAASGVYRRGLVELKGIGVAIQDTSARWRFSSRLKAEEVVQARSGPTAKLARKSQALGSVRALIVNLAADWAVASWRRRPFSRRTLGDWYELSLLLIGA
jgi:hypothetical protein